MSSDTNTPSFANMRQEQLPIPKHKLHGWPHCVGLYVGDGSSLSVRSSHPYEEGIYVFVQPIRGEKGNVLGLLGYSLAVTGTTSLGVLSGAMADIRPEARVAVAAPMRTPVRS